MHLKKAILSLIQGNDLTAAYCETLIWEMAKGGNPYQMAAFLALLHAKGETADEIFGIVHAMRELMVPVTVDEPLLDIVGTGGDGSHSVNISTGAAILAASCGAKVAKHGNRASSSKCGSADVLEELGISLEADPKVSLKEVGIAFLFAPLYHPAMKNMAPVRKALGVRTVFNLIGPLLNPAQPDHMLLGVCEERLLDLFADVVQKMGMKRCLIVYGNEMDELTPIGPCTIIEVTPDEKIRFTFDPKDYGFKRCSLSKLQGGSKEENARLLTAALKGKEGPIADSLILNAGAALYAYGRAPTLEEGFVMARETLKKGEAFQLLEKWRQK